ncbi:MAG TPA: hypothetical protein VK742_17690 [Candidatus Sulfotelmatobacter sp.]|nr:hypothetical protein [Candidatus Sulfotelmatobacter sp.]
MKKNLLFTTLLTAAVAFGVAGCGTTDSGTTDQQPAAQPAAAAAAAVPIPADSPFAKVKPGMSIGEVYSIIGQPTDTSHHITGKSFIPYYYGGDTHRMEAIYKGLGRIVFSPRNAFTSDMEVIEINYDPKESGYNQ